MSGSITIGIGQTETITQTGTYSPVTFEGLGTLEATGPNVVATIGDITAVVADTFLAEGGATLDFSNFIGISALNTYEIGNNGTIEIGSGLNVDLLSPINFDNTGGTAAQLTVDPGASLSLLSDIDGWRAGDALQLTGQTITSFNWTQNEGLFGPLPGGVLTIHTATNGTESLTFGNGSYTNNSFFASGDEITFACFAAGTLIDTPEGPVPVETLVPGAHVRVASGATRPVRWLGFRRLDLTRHADRPMVDPVRIAAGAFGDGLPRRHLIVSPDHALAVEGVLIPARMLVNEMTIRQDRDQTAITYYHVELETHDILLAEGLPAESYIDTGNRNLFENSAGPVALHPAFQDIDAPTRRTLGCCLPFAVDEARVRPVWGRLAARAIKLGYTPPPPPAMTDDPELILLIGNRRLRPIIEEGDHYTFVVPPSAIGRARLISRHMVPAYQRPWADDRRRLGVMVRQITLQNGDDERTIPVDHPLLTDGWWAMEGDAEPAGRWTTGNAVLPPLAGRSIVTVELACRASYALDGAADGRQVTAA
jgi:hypothetical protein